MKNSVRFLVLTFISLICLQSSGQTVGIKAGINSAWMQIKENGENVSAGLSEIPSFHAGLTVEFPFKEYLSLETGLLLSSKGMRMEEGFLGIYYKMDTRLYYLDLPVMLKVKYNFDKASLYAATGPYIGLGLSGKMTGTIVMIGETETVEEDIKWGNNPEDDDLKRFDAGITFGGGIEIKSILIGFSYDIGLYNISAYTDNGSTTRNRVYKLSLGYRF